MYFIDNHDENSWNGTVESRIGKNAHPAFILCSTMSQGMPLIYSGQEVGLNKSLRFFSRDTIDWKTPSQAEFYSKALALKKSQSSLANGGWGGNQKRIQTNNKSVYSFSRKKGRNSVIVFLNFDNKDVQVTYKDVPKGTYTNWFNDEDVTIKKTGEIFLAPNSFLVLTKD